MLLIVTNCLVRVDNTGVNTGNPMGEPGLACYTYRQKVRNERIQQFRRIFNRVLLESNWVNTLKKVILEAV